MVIIIIAGNVYRHITIYYYYCRHINPIVIINKQKHNDKNLEGSFKSHIDISTIEYYYYYDYYLDINYTVIIKNKKSRPDRDSEIQSTHTYALSLS